jgi:hypothetical protein
MREFRNRKVLVAAALMTCAMSSQAIAAPQYGQSGKTNQQTNGATTCFDKYLVLDDNANVPNYKSVYTIAPGNAVAGTKNTPEVFAGISADKITITQDNAFAPGQTTYQSVQLGDTVKFNEDQKYAKQNVTMNFGNVTYTQPGIYRYVVTETPATDAQQGITNDDDTSRFLDVYVETEETGKLGVVGYTFHKDEAVGTLADEPTFELVKAADLLRNGEYYVQDDSATTGSNGVLVDAAGKKYRPATQAEIDTAITNNNSTLYSAVKTLKDAGFQNLYTTYDVLLEKQVTGNQGNREEYFQFNVTVSGGVANSRYHVDLTNATPENIAYTTNGVNTETKSNIAQLTKGEILKNTGDTNFESEYYFTTDATGSANLTFYLKDDQYIEIWGLTKDMSYSVTEVAKDGEGYDISYKQDATKNTHDVSGQTKVDSATVTTQMGDSDDTVVYTNYRNGVVPTGIIMTAAPFVTAAGLASGMLVIGKKKRKK